MSSINLHIDIWVPALCGMTRFQRNPGFLLSILSDFHKEWTVIITVSYISPLYPHLILQNWIKTFHPSLCNASPGTSCFPGNRGSCGKGQGSSLSYQNTPLDSSLRSIYKYICIYIYTLYIYKYIHYIYICTLDEKHGPSLPHGDTETSSPAQPLAYVPSRHHSRLFYDCVLFGEKTRAQHTYYTRAYCTCYVHICTYCAFAQNIHPQPKFTWPENRQKPRIICSKEQCIWALFRLQYIKMTDWSASPICKRLPWK